MHQAQRIIDANANRAREALRVMEDAARFLLDDEALSATAKGIRHDLAAALRPFDDAVLHRDTPGDVGTRVTTDSERSRTSVADVVRAAGKRLSEALRAIEEYAKLEQDGGACAAAVEALRYRGYELERCLDLALSGADAAQWRLCVLLTESLCRRRDWFDVAQAVVEGGADCIQLREKSLEGGELLARATRLVELCRPADVSVIINDRPDVALLAGADGVHVGQTDMPCSAVRRLVGRDMIVGVSTSRVDEAMQARLDGASYCGVGPMFATTTKHKDIIMGPPYLREYVAWDGLPHLAIGGIHAGNVHELVDAGVRGIAVSSAVCAADDPRAAVEQLLAALPPSQSPQAEPNLTTGSQT